MTITLKYIGSLAVLLIMSLMYDKYKQKEGLDDEAKQYELVRKYLLNYSSLAQSKKPILWIHMDYQINARCWSSFGSRNNDHLNQPYLYLTIKSIIDKCGSDFNICIIDDSTFGKILPGWTVDLSMTSEPIREKLRELAIARTLHSYGGILVPRSFICLQNLSELYHSVVEENTRKCTMFVGEFIDKNMTSVQTNFFPSSKIMGCKKECPMMAEYIQYMEKINSTDFTEESKFTGGSERWFYEKIQHKQINMIPATALGVKDSRGKPITLEQLMSDSYIDINRDAVGLYVPEQEILKRTTYQWFARLSTEQVLDSDTLIGKYLLLSN
jgi:hypothetical protein